MHIYLSKAQHPGLSPENLELQRVVTPEMQAWLRL